MRSLLRVANWPLAWKVPLLAAGLMIGVAVLISQFVLSRLASDQESNLRLLTSAYLDGVSAAVLPAAQRADVWEAFDALDRARSHYAGVNVRFAILERPNGTVLAASDPLTFPVQSAVPVDVDSRFAAHDGLVIDNKSGRAWLSRTLSQEGFSIGRILAEIDISELLRVRRQVLLTLVAVNTALALGFAAVGSLALKRMLQPLSVFTGYVERIRDGRADLIPASKRRGLSREFDRLFDRFNAMARALNEREELASRLAEQERYAVLGKLASGMAHEVNNPLGGLFNALDTLRRHGDDGPAREATLNLLQRGLTHIRNVVRSNLVNYRRGDAQHSARAVDFDDLRLLIEPEASRKSIRLTWVNDIRGSLPVAGESVRQATLNLLINACAATPPGGVVRLLARATDNALIIDVGDQGPGLPRERAEYLLGRSEEGPAVGSGLGLWIVRRLVADEHGEIALVQESGLTTVVRTVWPFRSETAQPTIINDRLVEETIHAE
jgi:signal transduction histidine kinase